MFHTIILLSFSKTGRSSLNIADKRVEICWSVIYKVFLFHYCRFLWCNVIHCSRKHTTKAIFIFQDVAMVDILVSISCGINLLFYKKCGCLHHVFLPRLLLLSQFTPQNYWSPKRIPFLVFVLISFCDVSVFAVVVVFIVATVSFYPLVSIVTRVESWLRC